MPTQSTSCGLFADLRARIGLALLTVGLLAGCAEDERGDGLDGGGPYPGGDDAGDGQSDGEADDGEGDGDTGEDGEGDDGGSDETGDGGGSESGDSGNDDGGNYDGEPGEFVLDYDGRAYHLYVPAGYDHGTPAPLLFGFHGAGDNAANFYAVSKAAGWNSLADAQRVIVVVPDTKSPYSDFAVWSGDPNNDVPDMIVEMDDLLDLRDDLGTHYNLDPGGLYAFGFSDGGLFLGVTAMEFSGELASASVIGYGWGGVYVITPAEKIPMQFACGSADSFYSYATASEQFLAGQGHATRMLTAQGVGHDYTGVLGRYPPTDLWAWMVSPG